MYTYEAVIEKERHIRFSGLRSLNSIRCSICNPCDKLHFLTLMWQSLLRLGQSNRVAAKVVDAVPLSQEAVKVMLA